jgi:hypothetical protein
MCQFCVLFRDVSNGDTVFTWSRPACLVEFVFRIYKDDRGLMYNSDVTVSWETCLYGLSYVDNFAHFNLLG